MAEQVSSDISLQIVDLNIPILRHPKWIAISFPDENETDVLKKLNEHLSTAVDLAKSSDIHQLKIAAPTEWKLLDKAGFVPTVYFMTIAAEKLPYSAKTDAEIRAITNPSDIQKLIEGQFSYHSQADPQYYTQSVPTSVQTFIDVAAEAISLGNGFLPVAYLNEEPIGFLYAEHETDRGTIDELFIAEEYRGKGYGTALLSAARYHFEEVGSKTVEAYVSKNTQAVKFYDSRAFTKDLLNWVKNLE